MLRLTGPNFEVAHAGDRWATPATRKTESEHVEHPAARRLAGGFEEEHLTVSVGQWDPDDFLSDLGRTMAGGDSRYPAWSSAAAPMPPPMHIVTTPYSPAAPLQLAQQRRRSCRVPETPSGWPRAMAPPLGFTFAGSMPSSRMQYSDCAAKASFSSKTSMSFTVELVLREQLAHRGHRADAHDLRRHARHLEVDEVAERLHARAPSPSPRSSPPPRAAPSVSGEALPAVTVPLGLKAGLSLARPSSVVSGRRMVSSVDGDLVGVARLVEDLGLHGDDLVLEACRSCAPRPPAAGSRRRTRPGRRGGPRSAAATFSAVAPMEV